MAAPEKIKLTLEMSPQLYAKESRKNKLPDEGKS